MEFVELAAQHDPLDGIVRKSKKRTRACSRVAVVPFLTLEIFLPQPADAGRSQLEQLHQFFA
jgi:hypothetical protein